MDAVDFEDTNSFTFDGIRRGNVDYWEALRQSPFGDKSVGRYRCIVRKLTRTPRARNFIALARLTGQNFAAFIVASETAMAGKHFYQDKLGRQDSEPQKKSATIETDVRSLLIGTDFQLLPIQYPDRCHDGDKRKQRGQTEQRPVSESIRNLS